jgi:MYXO-CTERM domain-containing protein
MLRLPSSSLLFAVPLAFAGLAYAPMAHADVLPPDGCSGSAAAGSACDNAGPNNDEDGVCTLEPGCSPSLHDAGPCMQLLCEIPSAHDAGTPDTGAGDAISPGLIACATAGGKCVGVVPNACSDGHVGSPNTYTCGGGIGDECCLPNDVDAGSKDAGKPTKDAGKPTKDAGGSGTGTGAGNTDAGTELGSSSGCAVSASESGSGDAAWFVGLGVVGLAMLGSRRKRSGE